jgi:ribosomal protein L32
MSETKRRLEREQEQAERERASVCSSCGQRVTAKREVRLCERCVEYYCSECWPVNDELDICPDCWSDILSE